MTCVCWSGGAFALLPLMIPLDIRLQLPISIFSLLPNLYLLDRFFPKLQISICICLSPSCLNHKYEHHLISSLSLTPYIQSMTESCLFSLLNTYDIQFLFFDPYCCDHDTGHHHHSITIIGAKTSALSTASSPLLSSLQEYEIVCSQTVPQKRYSFHACVSLFSLFLVSGLSSPNPNKYRTPSNVR